ncbi:MULTISPECIES: hypothetical protein [unclassified Curtobacterium]|uniref:hypothetical protein n=1 Tax=unclassified Curtobacterium TaxID=257496 RepID=UPI000DA0401A|nr:MULTISPECIES: hypothetical protein [unclassified Curtobacterium]PYY39368.1 hypothetical protein DEJ32_08570 [Curtobacterium sp. MCPF17_046]PYY46540.1 hypothetical protein DEI84_12645 [Curtobacterium sp. MCBD17_023]WIB15187.1 hypothetical protein DEJ34_13770 [Curtobacterium sp. MCPF17_050]
MSLLDLIDTLDDRGAEDAASDEQIHAVQSVLTRALVQEHGSPVSRSLVREAGRLVADSWPVGSELGALVLTFAQSV